MTRRSNFSLFSWLLLYCILPLVSCSSISIDVLAIENGNCDQSDDLITIDTFNIECSSSGSSHSCPLTFGRVVKFSGTMTYALLDSSTMYLSVIIKDNSNNESYSLLENALIDICSEQSFAPIGESECPNTGSSSFSGMIIVPSELKDSFHENKLIQILAKFSNVDENAIFACTKVVAETTTKSISVKGYFSYYVMCSIVSGAGLLFAYLCTSRHHQKHRRIESLDDGNFITNKVNLQRTGDKDVKEIIPEEWYDTLDNREYYA